MSLSQRVEGGRAPHAVQRRRGEALEAALLDASWEELLAHGYDDLTFEGVARRAGTSRAVVYRRWPTKPDLARAAIEHGWSRQISPVPDTGSVRGDLLALLREANHSKVRLVTLAALQLSGFFAETGSSISELRDAFVGPRQRAGLDSMATIFGRAVARGEIDPAKLTPRVRTVVFDLFRHDLLLHLKPVPDEALVAIVDEVFLPLVRPQSSATGSSTPS